MKLYRLPLGSYGTNCYVYGDDEAAHWIIVDPGNNGKELVEWLKEQNAGKQCGWEATPTPVPAARAESRP